MTDTNNQPSLAPKAGAAEGTPSHPVPAALDGLIRKRGFTGSAGCSSFSLSLS